MKDTRFSLKALRDETGAESAEIILVLVLLVIGLMAAWAVLREKLVGRIEDTADCIESADLGTTC